jgi:hypothetical protein
MPMSNHHPVTRRRFLKTGLNLASSFALGVPLAVSGARPAKADGGVTFAVVVAAVNLANSLFRMSERSGGLNQRLQAMQLELDAILQTQMETLDAVNEVNNNLVKLQELIPNLLTKQEYFTALKDVKTANDEVRNFGIDVQRAQGKSLGPRDFDLFHQAFQSTRSALSKLDQTTSESIEGDPGVAAMAYAACSITMLAEQCFVLSKVEPFFPEDSKIVVWNAANQFSQLRDDMMRILTTLKTQRLPPLYREQTSIRDAEEKRLSENPWSTGFFQSIATGSGPTNFDVCLITSVPHHVDKGRYCPPEIITNINHSIQPPCSEVYDDYETQLLHHRQFTVDAVRLSAENGVYHLAGSLIYGDETQSQGSAACDPAEAPNKSLEEHLVNFSADATSYSKAIANVVALRNVGAVASQVENKVALLTIPG